MKPQKDRLSEMPDEVIVHILSYLPIVDAVRTMLIRPFGTLWTLIPTLKFEAKEVLNKMAPDGKWESDESDDVGRFHMFVRNVLMLHRKPVIDKFHLVLEWLPDQGRTEAGDDIKMWLRFAFDKQAKEIVFHDVGNELTDSSHLPNFTSQSLITLQLSHCCICPQLQVNLGSLKKLIFCYTEMREETFRQFICGCPSLQELHIVEPCFYPKNMCFSAPNILKLSLVLVVEDFSYDPWLLDFPNLKTLDLEIDQIPDVIDVSSVQDVYLKNLFIMDDENELRRFNIFLEKFSRSEVFQLSCNASEPFLHSIDDSRLLQIRWKCLVLRLRIFCQSCLLGIYQLMRSSKHLEELTIYTTRTLTYKSVCNTPDLFSGQYFQASADLSPIELSYPCVLPKLKTVTLNGYVKPWKHQLQLIEFFLKSATVLEKLVIVLNKRQSTAVEKLNFVMHVSTFQRSSPSARVSEWYGCFPSPHSTRLHNYGFLGDFSYGICSLIFWTSSNEVVVILVNMVILN